MSPFTQTARLPLCPVTPQDAIHLLWADHDAVRQWFADFEATRSAAAKRALVARICSALAAHAQIEEEIFYPAVKSALRDTLLVPESAVEHAGVESLARQLAGVGPDGERYDAKVRVLGEYVRHHVRREQNEMFPRAMASSLDLDELGARMAARRDDLLSRRLRAVATSGS